MHKAGVGAEKEEKQTPLARVCWEAQSQDNGIMTLAEGRRLTKWATHMPQKASNF